MATWGANSWGDNSWGTDQNIISVSGIGATFSLGNESSQANADVIPTSISITANQGNENIVIATTGNPTGIGTTFSLGTADAGPDAMVTGLDTVTASVGTVDAYNIEGWGRQQWNTFAWGITGSLLTTGEQANANLGSIADVIGTANVDLTGIQLTANLGTALEIIAVEVSVTGIDLTSNLGIADAGPDAMLTGIGGTASVGSVEAYNLEGWGRYFYGQFEWGATGEWESVELTGIALSANLGDETITGNANVTANTLNVAQVTIANVDPAPDAGVTGNFMIGSLGQLGMQGDVPQDVTGIAMSAGLGSVVAVPAQEVDVTGLPALARVASVTPIIHVDVQVTGNALTMAQGSGSALIWNEVNTGTAPIDPPGWQEVAA